MTKIENPSDLLHHVKPVCKEQKASKAASFCTNFFRALPESAATCLAFLGGPISKGIAAVFWATKAVVILAPLLKYREKGFAAAWEEVQENGRLFIRRHLPLAGIVCSGATLLWIALFIMTIFGGHFFNAAALFSLIPITAAITHQVFRTLQKHPLPPLLGHRSNVKELDKID